MFCKAARSSSGIQGLGGAWGRYGGRSWVPKNLSSWPSEEHVLRRRNLVSDPFFLHDNE